MTIQDFLWLQEDTGFQDSFSERRLRARFYEWRKQVKFARSWSFIFGRHKRAAWELVKFQMDPLGKPIPKCMLG